MESPQSKRTWGADGLFFEVACESGITHLKRRSTVDMMSPASSPLASRNSSRVMEAGSGPLYSGGLTFFFEVSDFHWALRVIDQSFGLKGKVIFPSSPGLPL